VVRACDDRHKGRVGILGLMGRLGNVRRATLWFLRIPSISGLRFPWIAGPSALSLLGLISAEVLHVIVGPGGGRLGVIAAAVVLESGVIGGA